MKDRLAQVRIDKTRNVLDQTIKAQAILDKEVARVNDRVNFLYENNEPMMRIVDGYMHIGTIPIAEAVQLILNHLNVQLSPIDARHELKEIVDDDNAKD